MTPVRGVVISSFRPQSMVPPNAFPLDVMWVKTSASESDTLSSITSKSWTQLTGLFGRTLRL